LQRATAVLQVTDQVGLAVRLVTVFRRRVLVIMAERGFVMHARNFLRSGFSAACESLPLGVRSANVLVAALAVAVIGLWGVPGLAVEPETPEFSPVAGSLFARGELAQLGPLNVQSDLAMLEVLLSAHQPGIDAPLYHFVAPVGWASSDWIAGPAIGAQASACPSERRDLPVPIRPDAVSLRPSWQRALRTALPTTIYQRIGILISRGQN
jgi:hypothetical protein